MALNQTSRKPVRSHLLDRFIPGSQSAERGHIVELDSLRGVAAMVVVLGHYTFGWMEASPSHFVKYLFYVPVLMNPNSAVLLFFVLSGFVLTLPMLSAQRLDYSSYAVRRISRIYLPYVAALLAAVACCWRFHGLQLYGASFRSIWSSAPTWPMVGWHLVFLGRYNVLAFDPPVWSLVHEMRISLIFPLLCLITLRLRAWAVVLIAAFFPVMGRLIEILNTPYSSDYYPGDSMIFWSSTVGFCGVFLIGSLLARYRGAIVSRVMALPVAVNLLGAAVAVVFYQYASVLHIPRPLRPFLIALGAAYFVAFALVPDGWLSRLLHLAPLRFLGRISYSIYLVHVPVLMLVSIALWGKGIGGGLVLLPYLGIVLAVAALFHRFVEVPSITLGKSITAGWRLRATGDGGEALVTEPVA